jgi:hypothetical protein
MVRYAFGADDDVGPIATAEICAAVGWIHRIARLALVG